MRSARARGRERGESALVRVVLVLPVLLACAGGPARLPDPVPRAAAEWNDATTEAAERLAAHLGTLPVATSARLTLRLAFHAGADLDLYVSDPQQETVYYGNTPVRSGGRLLRDRHCKDAGSGIRVEEIVFAEPLAGRYRVGVDYPHRCDGGAGTVAYVITIIGPGGRRELRGLAKPIVFTPIVAEIEIDPGGDRVRGP